MKVLKQHILTKWAEYCVLIFCNALKNLFFGTLNLKLLVPFYFAIFDLPFHNIIFHTFDVLTILLPHPDVNSL